MKEKYFVKIFPLKKHKSANLFFWSKFRQIFIFGRLVAINSKILKGIYFIFFNNKSPCITKSLLGCFLLMVQQKIETEILSQYT